jgi:hypothetical protein
MDLDVAEEINLPWEKEHIPDDALLFMRVHKNQLDPNGEPIPGAFKNRPKSTDGMSTDWNEYSSAKECRLRARTPEDNAILQLRVGDVRQISLQTVEHTPIYNSTAATPPILNRAHTDVFGEKNTEVRLHFIRIYRMVIRIEELL